MGQYMEETELCFTENKQKAVMTTKWYFTRIPNYRPACTSEAAIEDCGGTTCVSFTVLFSGCVLTGNSPQQVALGTEIL